jgi:hypothetical protein
MTAAKSPHFLAQGAPKYCEFVCSRLNPKEVKQSGTEKKHEQRDKRHNRSKPTYPNERMLPLSTTK